MPLQNRVDPFGNIVAHSARGLLMGNRGCLHDHAGNIVRNSDRAAWITCLPSWPGIRRKLMSPGHYTELFFLDEATALAAGHRPCGNCRPDALTAFKEAWAASQRLSYLPRVTEIDSALRAASASELTSEGEIPDGAMVDAGGTAVLRWHARWLTWSFNGYTYLQEMPAAGRAITVAPMLAILRAGYTPMVHSSAST